VRNLPKNVNIENIIIRGIIRITKKLKKQKIIYFYLK
jgi:hypothetical protein